MVKKIPLALCLLFTVQYVSSQKFDETFKLLVNKAYEKSSEIKINNYKTDQIRTDRQTAKNAFLPRVSASANFVRLNDDIVLPDNLQALLLGSEKLLIKEALGIPFNTALPSTVPVKPIDIVQQKNMFTISGNAQMLLFSGFKVPLTVKATEHQEKAMQLLNEKEQNKLLVEMSELYDKLALVLASETVLNSSETVLNQQAHFVEEAIKNGLATPIERQRIELAKQRLAVKRLEFTSNKTLLVEKMHQLTDMDYTQLINLHPTLQEIVFANDTGRTVERIEISSINEVLLALDYKQKITQTDYIPKLGAFGQYEFRKQDLSSMVPTWLVGVRLQWNLFDGFGAKEASSKIEMDKKIYSEKKKEIKDLQRLGVTKAGVEFATANQKIQMTKEQVSLAERTYDLTNKQYKNGLTTLTELLNSINEKEKANLDLAAAYYEQRKAGIELLDAKGTLSLN